MNKNLLQGANVFLRALEPEDLELLYKWENDTDTWSVSETLSPISRFILKKYLENSHRDIFETKQLRLMVSLNETGQSIGTIDLFSFDHFHKRAGVGILIGEKSERKKGYALEALEILKQYCFEVLHLKQIYCSISVENTSSSELFKKAGFVITGTRKSWVWNGKEFNDVYFMQLIR